jgi:hypothetical protein
MARGTRVVYTKYAEAPPLARRRKPGSQALSLYSSIRRSVHQMHTLSEVTKDNQNTSSSEISHHLLVEQPYEKTPSCLPPSAREGDGNIPHYSKTTNHSNLEFGKDIS